MTEPHDSVYKRLFTHPRMVADLLRGFVPEPWIDHLDFSTLQQSKASYVSESLKQRHDDLIWRLNWGKETLYIYLLLEFQSSPLRFMAVRLISYLALFYEDLIDRGELGESNLLPPVLPLVLYNGARPWLAPTELEDLIIGVPGGLEAYRPSLRYLVIDQHRVDAARLASLRNVVAALFLLEKSERAEDVQQVVDRLIDWLDEPHDDELRRSFTSWLTRVLLPVRMPGAPVVRIEELKEFRTMLSEQAIPWAEFSRQEGRQEGRLEGEAAMLLRLIEKRFGKVTAGVQRRIGTADAARLLDWGERLLEAERLEEIFGD